MFSLFIPGKPRGKGRPRVTKNGTFTPKATKEYESRIKAEFTRKYIGTSLIKKGVPVRVTIVAYFKMPKNISKVKKH